MKKPHSSRGGTGTKTGGWTRVEGPAPGRRTKAPGPIRVSLCGRHEWSFDLRPENPEFEAGCELLEAGRQRQALVMFKRASENDPLDIDVMHHVAVVLEGEGRDGEARRLRLRAVALGREAMPKDFQRGKDRLPWGILENRPFLRALHGLGLSEMALGNKAGALDLFEEILDLNPNDNQGVRELALELYYDLGNLDKALQLVNVRYKNDGMAGLMYGRPLALFKTGARERADKELRAAVKFSPKIAAELLKKSHRRPAGELPGYITMGGWDEAYSYWQTFGRFWDKDALEWLQNTARALEPVNP